MPVKKKASTPISLLLIIFISLLGLAVFYKLIYLKQRSEKLPTSASQLQTLKLPEDFPQIPMHPQALLQKVERGYPEDGIYYQATWEAEENIPQLSSWFLDNLKQNGWSIEIPPADVSATDVQFIVAERQDVILNLSLISGDVPNLTRVVAQFPTQATADEEED